jgi:hypothetical protein
LMRLLKIKTQLKDLFKITAFQMWLNEQDFETQNHAEKIKDIVLNERTWLMINLLSKICWPLLKVCRFYDQSRSGSGCFIYLLFFLLSESVLTAIAHPEFNSVITPQLGLAIKRCISKGWAKFHFPVYSASFLLSPNLRSMWMHTTLGEDRGLEFDDIRLDTLSVLRSMVRRFPVNCMEARDAVAWSRRVNNKV